MDDEVRLQNLNAAVVQRLARLPGTQEIHGLSPGCGATVFVC